MIDSGWIKLHRKIMNNVIYKDAHLLHLFIHCLMKANHKEHTFLFNSELITVNRGQFITGRFELAKELKQNPSSIYKRLKILEKLQILNIKSNNKFSLLTILKYDTYQEQLTTKEQQKEQPSNNKVTTKEQQNNTNKNDKKEENEKNEKKESKDIAVKTPQNDFLDNLIDIFSEEYLIAKGIDYIIQSQDKKSIGRLLASYKKKNKESDSEKCLKDFRNLFRSACDISDDNFLSQISISFLNSQINKYLNYIKNGKSKQSYGNKSKGFDIDKERRIAERLASIN